MQKGDAMKSKRSRSVFLLVLGSAVLLTALLGASRAITTEKPAYAGASAVASESAFVPAGQFLMGCSPDLFPDGCDGDTYPIHAVYLD